MNETREDFVTFWLIERDAGTDNGSRGRRVFMMGAGGDPETLPVFSFEEEALLFLRLGGLERHWHTSGFATPDLVSALTGPYRGARRVVLDPFPDIGLRGYLDALSLSRGEFVDLLGCGGGGRPRTAGDPSAPETSPGRVLRRVNIRGPDGA